ncbi:MAG TPA: APC family permease [Methanobacterium sp.]|jgi:APA family basic amino acid/polyamine antiporter|nr:MAG: amino acid permease [Methanobacterium sp.]HOI72331.1 APC family permease [Methanobacterium sp.]
MVELKRDLGVWGAASIGIGAIIGTGIFVLLGVAAGLAGPSVIFSFIIAGITALLTGLSSAELSSFITEEGGSYIYTTKAFGKFPGFVIGWIKSFDYIIGASAVSIGFASYFTYFLHLPPIRSTIITIATVWPIILMLLNIKGMREASVANTGLVVLKVSALVVFIITGVYYMILHGNPSNYYPFFPNGLNGMLSGAAIIFFAFIGFNTITMVAEEVKHPQKNVPRAVLLSFAVCTLLYIGVSLVAVGLVNWQILGQSTAPLETALGVATNNIWILEFVAISALFATTSVILSSIIGGSRALFSMARQDVIPEVFSKISGNGIPIITVIISGISIALIVVVASGNLDALASIFNFGTLLTFAFINLSLLQLRRTMPDRKRGFKVPFYPLTPILGLASCVGLAFYLNPNAVIYGVSWILIGIMVFSLNKWRIKRKLKSP